MTLKKAIKNFENLKSQTDNKSERKIFNEFISILSKLENKNLSENDVHCIELNLDTLDINFLIKENKKYYNKTLHQFKKYLNTEFSFITKRHYTNLGISLGMCFGISFGTLFGNPNGTSFGLTTGMIIGLVIGQYLDNQAESEGKVI